MEDGPCEHEIAHNECRRKNANSCKWKHDLPSHEKAALRPWAKLWCVACNAKNRYYPSEQRTDPLAKIGPSVSDSCGPRY